MTFCWSEFVRFVIVIFIAFSSLIASSFILLLLFKYLTLQCQKTVHPKWLCSTIGNNKMQCSLLSTLNKDKLHNRCTMLTNRNTEKRKSKLNQKQICLTNSIQSPDRSTTIDIHMHQNYFLSLVYTCTHSKNRNWIRLLIRFDSFSNAE